MSATVSGLARCSIGSCHFFAGGAWIGEDNIFHSTGQAIAEVFARLDRSVCARCTARIFLACKALPPPETPSPLASGRR